MTDTEWSEPGESLGKPDRYQFRTHRECFLSAGSNWRDNDGSYTRAADDVPWRASLLVSGEHVEAVVIATGGSTSPYRQPGGGATYIAITGTATSQDAARRAAEQAADRLVEALVDARAK